MTKTQLEYVFRQAQAFVFQPMCSIDLAESWANHCEFTQAMRMTFFAIVKSIPLVEY